MYITEKDLNNKIRQSDLMQIVGASDTTIRPSAIAYAEGQVATILGAKFNVDKLFSAQGDKREEIIVSAICDIAIYEIVAIAQPNIDLSDRAERAKRAINYLKDVARGEFPVAWPLKDEVSNTKNSVIHGGNPSRGNYF